jgi:hypothetical protein
MSKEQWGAATDTNEAVSISVSKSDSTSEETSLTSGHTLLAIEAFKHPNFISLLSTHKIPFMVGVMVQIERLANVMRKREISWHPISLQIERAYISKGQWVVMERSEQWAPNTAYHL